MRYIKTYDDFKLDCELELKPGVITALIGRNGAGKTTLFKLYLGLLENENGKVNRIEKDKIGTVWNDSSFSLSFNACEIKKIMKNVYVEFNENYYDQMLKHFELDPKKKLKDYSTGMLSKLKVIIATSHQAKVLLLDEPTSGLDVIARNEVCVLLKDYMESHQEASILISSHISRDLETLCDEFYFIEKGRIVLKEQDLDAYAILKVAQNQSVDLSYVLKKIGNSYLTNQRQYYMENYPEIIIEKAHIDDLMEFMIQGDNV